MTVAPPDPGPVAQVTATVQRSAPASDYRHLTLLAPAIAAAAAPGQFVALAVGGPTSGLLLRRSFSIHRVTPDDGGTGRTGEPGTVEIVVADAGPGTRWLVGRRPGDRVDVVGPLGRGFRQPAGPAPAILLGGGYGSAPLFWLAEELTAAGSPVVLVLGAASRGRLFGHESAGDAAYEIVVTTDDGSSGRRGLVTDPLPELLAATGARAVYACGPMPMLRAVAEIAAAHGANAQVAVEEAMACGIGVCMTCVLPVAGADGTTRMSRSCVDGPVLDGSAVRWDAIGGGRAHVPADCLGAPAATGGAR